MSFTRARCILTPLVAASALACIHAPDIGVPLYPNADTRLPRSQVARVDGPLATVDGQDVRGLGGLFDLLPGCHVVEVDPRAPPNSAYSSKVVWGGQYTPAIYALHMTAGADYVIRRDFHPLPGQFGGRIDVTAREEDASGTVTDLHPVTSDADISACKAWEAALASGGPS